MTVLTLRTTRPEAAVVLVSGDLAGDAADELQEAAVELISRTRPSLLIHLGRVRSIDPRAVRVLLAARQRAELLGGRVLVVRPSAAVREALRNFGIGHLLQVVE
jgi:anti-anti-sigma factor